MNYIFTLRGEVPAKKNSRTTLKSGKTIPSKNYQKWHEMAVFSLIFAKKTQNLHESISFPVEIEITFIHGDLRRRDSDNGLSSILDTLTDAGILADDCWTVCRKLSVTNCYEKENPSCKIIVRKMTV